MKAIVKYGDAPGCVDFRDIPEPVCGECDVKIEIKAAAICITDLHIMAGTYPWKTGVPLGHEFCGVVTEAGEKVTRFRVGDRVVACMDGGFAKYVVKHENDWVFPLPDEISFEEGALLEPLSAAANSVINKSCLKPGDSVLIEGPGVIGLFVLQVCKLTGARVMISGTGADVQRLALAREFGADRTVNVEEEDLRKAAEEFSLGKGIDTVFECSGSQPALDLGLEVLKYDGQLTQVGIFGKPAVVDLGQLVYHNRRIVGSIAYDRETWIRTIELVRTRKVNVARMISARLPLAQWEEGFRMARNKEGLRILLIP